MVAAFHVTQVWDMLLNPKSSTRYCTSIFVLGDIKYNNVSSKLESMSLQSLGTGLLVIILMCWATPQTFVGLVYLSFSGMYILTKDPSC